MTKYSNSAPGSSNSIEGGCTCGHIRYKLTSNPMIVHGCHCRWCQRQTGTVFAQNALIEADRVVLLSGVVEEVEVASPGGSGQNIVRCPNCKIALWSNYLSMSVKKHVNFIRVGTLDNPDIYPPDVHIYTSTKQPWFELPANVQAVEEFYDYDTTWSKDSQNRLAALKERLGV